MTLPIQPTYIDEHGVLRFKENKIVRYLLDNGGIDLNRIASHGFSQEDMEQFAQLIGYSLSCFAELSFVSDETYAAASIIAETGVTEEQAKIAYLQAKLKDMKDGLRQTVSDLYNIAPEDLK